jgi:hypothetical protein
MLKAGAEGVGVKFRESEGTTSTPAKAKSTKTSVMRKADMARNYTFKSKPPISGVPPLLLKGVNFVQFRSISFNFVQN